MSTLGMMSADCMFGDHDFRYSGRCPCGVRLRCGCGAFAGADDDWWHEHEKTCPALRGLPDEDQRP